MLKPPATRPAPGAARFAERRLPYCTLRSDTLRRLLVLLLATAITQLRAAQTSWAADVVPLLAQAQKAATTTAEPAAEGGGWPVLDWLIVVVLIGGALYAICRSSRRN